MLISAFDIAENFKQFWLMEFSKNEVWFELLFRVYVIVLEVDAETKESTGETEEKLDGRYKEGHERENHNEDQWEDRKRWSLGFGQRRKTFWNRYISYMFYCTVFEEDSFISTHLMALLISMERISVCLSVCLFNCLSVRSYRNLLGTLRNHVIMNYVSSRMKSSK